MRKHGFTLIELLTVIAIIAILAAILFPVFQRVKTAAKRSADMSNMQTLHSALKLYQTDQGGYPPLLLQVVEYKQGQQLPVDRLARAYLYKSRVKDADVFKSVMNDADRFSITNACWPERDPESDPGNPNDYQAFGPTDVVLYKHLGIDPTFLTEGLYTQDDPAQFYTWDTYDVSPEYRPVSCGTIPPNALRYELRYTLFWTQQGLLLGGGPNDNPRQLGYNEPDETTVVTWNNMYRLPYQIDPTVNYPGYSNVKVPRRENADLVLLLSGTVKPADSQQLYFKSWRFNQNP
ncbi:MAG TPA: type II secretion system protein [Fimbriimonadales bacterium]|nr:type II secretion system protein [Fimbriimonadales bacterium]